MSPNACQPHPGGASVVLAAIAAAIGMMPGCAGPNHQSQTRDEQVAAYVPPARPAEPALRTAGDAQMTPFGELPDQSRVPFQARSAAPMKQHTFATEGADFDVDISPDGKWLVFASTRHSAQPDLYLKTVDGRAVTQLTSDPAADVQPCFSPDGRTILFASMRGGNWDIWSVGLNGGQARQITHSPLHEVHPSFAPDGKRFVYCLFNDRAGEWELWTQQMDQPGSRKMIGLGLFPEWSPIGDSIVYQKARERGGRWFSIWRVDLEMGEPKFPVEVVSHPDMALIQPSWSPDGAWITYGTAKLGTEPQTTDGTTIASMTSGDIWVIQADGNMPTQLTDGPGAGFGPVWGRDGRVYFTSTQNGNENLWSAQPMLGSTAQAPAILEDKPAVAAPANTAVGVNPAAQGG